MYNTLKRGKADVAVAKRTNPWKNQFATGSRNRHNRHSNGEYRSHSMKIIEVVTKLNTYTRAGRCGSALVVARLIREYRASSDSQTSGRCVRPKNNLVLFGGNGGKQEASIILEELMSGSSRSLIN